MGSEKSMETAAHNQTYAGFISMMKWGTVATVIVTVIVVLLIAS